MHELLIWSGVALAIMAVLAVALGWLVAGRVLRPLRTMATSTQQITEHNLHERLALPGPSDEIKDLADTIDGLLQRLEAAFDAQRHFVANASHELRTPLTLNRALLEFTLANPDATIEDLRNMSQELIASGEQQEQLIEALLTLAVSARGLERYEPFDLSEITAHVLLGPRPEIDQLGIDVQTTSPPHPQSVTHVWPDGSSATSSTTHSATTSPAVTSTLRREPTPIRRFSRSPTVGRSFPKTTSTDCCSPSSGSTRTGRTIQTATGSDSPSSNQSPPPTARRSPPTPSPVAGSASRCDSRGQHDRRITRLNSQTPVPSTVLTAQGRLNRRSCSSSPPMGLEPRVLRCSIQSEGGTNDDQGG